MATMTSSLKLWIFSSSEWTVEEAGDMVIDGKD